MSNKLRSKHHGRKTRPEWVCAVLALVLPGAVVADWKLSASVGATETYTDNVGLGTNTGRQRGDFITGVTPSFSAKKEGARLKVDAQYALQNLFYAQNSSLNSIFHQLNARANVELFENEFFLDTTATIAQTALSPLNATGSDNLNASNNIANNRAITLSPYWTHRFGSTANLNVRNTASYVSNDSAEFSNSTNNTFSAGLTSGSDFGRVSWGLNVLQTNSQFDNRSNVSFSSSSVSLGYLVSSRVRLTGTVGNENNSFQTTTGSTPGGAFWNANVAWSPSIRTSVDIGFGNRYFGNTWSFAFKTRGAHYNWTADYSESVNTSNNQFGNSGLSANVNQQQIITDISLFNRNILTNQVFLSKRFSTAFGLTRGRNEFRLAAFHSTQTTQIDQNTNTVSQSLRSGALTNSNDIFLLTNDFKQLGFDGSWSWRLTPQITSNVTFGVVRNSFSGLNRTDTTSSLQFGLNRQFSRQLTGGVSLRHQNRDSNQSTSDFKIGRAHV